MKCWPGVTFSSCPLASRTRVACFSPSVRARTASKNVRVTPGFTSASSSERRTSVSASAMAAASSVRTPVSRARAASKPRVSVSSMAAQDREAGGGAGGMLGGMPTVVTAEIAGNVWRVEQRVGARVAAEDVLLVLESMKMEIPVEAPCAGTVTEIRVREGDKVEEGTVLAVIAE